ncbi:MAG: DUF4178 domain-containing protein [Candidatus Eremiobacteraeota bacterium]|nr:DUF4178 domain-containing protein [Candidatus Eremiobacteraeota bacterium]
MEPQEQIPTGAKSVKCPHCGSSLEVKSSLLSRALYCSHCDSSLSMKDGKEEEKGGEMEILPPKSALKVGAVADFKQGKFRIIGRIHYRNVKLEEWDEWLLLAESGDYLWIVEDDWSFIVTQKFTPDDPPDPEKSSYHVVFEGQELKVDEYSKAVVSFFEGELTWAAKVGDTVNYLDAWKGNDTVYSIEWSDREILYFKGWEKDVRDIYKAFNITEAIPPIAFEKDDDDEEESPPARKTSYAEFAIQLMGMQVYWVTLAAGIIFLLAGWWLSSYNGSAITRQYHEIVSPKSPELILGPFEVKSPGTVHKAVIQTEVKNEELYCEFNVLNKNKESVGTFDHTFWQEDPDFESSGLEKTADIKCTRLFVPREKGTYYLQIVPENTKDRAFHVTVYEKAFSPPIFFTFGKVVLIYPGLVTAVWSILTGIIFFLLFAYVVVVGFISMLGSDLTEID